MDSNIFNVYLHRINVLEYFVGRYAKHCSLSETYLRHSLTEGPLYMASTTFIL